MNKKVLDGLRTVCFYDLVFINASLETYFNKLDYNYSYTLNFINAYSFYLYHKNENFKSAIDYGTNFVDGVGIQYLTNLYSKSQILKHRVTGMDALGFFLKRANKFNEKVMFVGSNQATINCLIRKIKNSYRDMRFNCISAPYFRVQMENDDNDKLVRQIIQFSPAYLFVGLSAPKQEIWSFNNRHKFPKVKVILNVGAAFNFYAGVEPRAPKILRKFGLEGVFRTIINPKKHIPRDFKSSRFVLYKIFKDKLFIF